MTTGNFKKFLAICTLAGSGVLCWCMPALAAHNSTTFSQKILPLNCIYTVVNAGTGELYYVTPAACGVPPTPPPSSGGAGSPSTSQQQSTQQFNPDRTLFFVPSTTTGQQTTSEANSSSGGQSQLSWQPLATIASQNNGDKKDAVTTAKLKLNTAMAVGFTAGLILVVVIVALLI
jgi:hypothetical protein